MCGPLSDLSYVARRFSLACTLLPISIHCRWGGQFIGMLCNVLSPYVPGKCFETMLCSHSVSALVLECFCLRLRSVLCYSWVSGACSFILWHLSVVSDQGIQLINLTHTYHHLYCFSHPESLLCALYISSCLFGTHLDVLTDVSHLTFLSSLEFSLNTTAQLTAFLLCRCSIPTTWSHLDSSSLVSHLVCLEILLLYLEIIFRSDQPFITSSASTMLPPDRFSQLHLYSCSQNAFRIVSWNIIRSCQSFPQPFIASLVPFKTQPKLQQGHAKASIIWHLFTRWLQCYMTFLLSWCI